MKQQQTSITSYHKLDQSKTEAQKQLILSKFQKWYPLSFSHRDIANLTHLEINIVESRCTTLANEGLIELVGLKYQIETERDVNAWRLKK